MLNSWQDESKRSRIIVALDCDASEAQSLASSLKGHASWLKIGMTLFYSEGPQIIESFKEQGFNIFVDLKLHDIPHQVKGAAASLAQCGADLITVHASGGIEMMNAAYEGAHLGEKSCNNQAPAICAVTVLTSMNDEMLSNIGILSDAQAQVNRLAHLVAQTHLNGIVCSPQEASLSRKVLGEDALIITPGVRPLNANLGDQSRVATPQEAFASGASHIVIGRPITQAQDPVQAFEDIAKEL